VRHVGTDELEAGLAAVRASPPDGGTVELIVRRPAVGEREVVDRGTLDGEDGLVGDTWQARGSRHTDDGSAEVDRQLTLMNDRFARLIAGGDDERRTLAGDQLYVDLDLSVDNLPPGSRLELGDAVIEITDKPHTGCAKFSGRFGVDALRFVNAPTGTSLRLRGVNARVVRGGTVKAGDEIRKSR
jgi:hypothetical protein